MSTPSDRTARPSPSASASASASACGSPPRRLLSLLSTFALSLLLVCLQASSVSASHFAYGTLSWEHAPTPAQPNYYLVNFEVAFRRSYGWTPRNPSAGTYFTSSDVGTIVVSQTQNAGPCCGLPTSNYCYTQNSGLPGRGCGIWSLTLPKLNILTKVTYPDDWLSGQTTGLSFSAPTHTPNTQRLTLVYTMCCRINTLVYSAGQYTRVQADLVPPHRYSPRSTSFPRQYVVINTPVSWSVPSIHPLGWPLSYDLSTLAESSLTQQKPMGSQGTFSLNTASGAVTWTPLLLGLMAVQFKVMAVDPDNVALGRSMVVLDTIFEVIKECTLASLNCFHNPVFDPAVPAQAVFYQGSSGTFTVTARSDDNNAVEIFTNIMPPGASINFVSAVGGKNSAGRDAKWTTYQVLWTPTLTDVPHVVCFTARDPVTQMSSSGSNCVNFVFGKGSILYLSGILRDFHSSAAFPTYLTDFNRPETTVDSARTFVQTSLGTNKIVPTFAGSPTSTNAANFDWWFKTDDSQAINRPQVYDIVLNNATTSRPNIFMWDSGSNWWPLDNQLFGNEGDTHNKYFTLEVHTYITYTGGEVLLFESSDDLWVYIDGKLPGGAGWPLSGILSTQLRATSIALDSVFTAAQKQQTFAVDLFYAHRGRTSQPQLKISLLSATLCNSIDSGLTVVDTADLGLVTLVGAAQPPVGGKLQLMTNTPSNTGAAWFNVGAPTPNTAQPYKVSHGFDATFTFKWDGRTEGFAFVLQFDNGAAQGGQGGQLGYGGLAGIKNSIAVEFDGVSLSSMGDPAWQHVSIHSRFAAANDANELSRISGSVYSAESLNLAFHNGTEHNVRVRYIPGVDNGQGGPQLGWIRVYLGIAGKEFLPVPVTSAQVDGVVLEQMWHGAAYAGFTASTSDSNFANIFISNFKLVVVPPSASKSFGSRLPTVMTAGEVGSMVVQLKDVCGNVITTGNDCQSLSASVRNTDRPGLSQTLVCCTSASCGAGTIQDNGDGSYTLRYNPTFANAASNPWRVHVTYASDGPATALPIAGSPFQFSVEPGTTSPLLSTFAVTYNDGATEPRSGAQGSGSVGTVTITARDGYGNLQTALTDPFLVTFDPDITAGGTASAPGGALSPTLKTGPSSYTTTFWTTQSRTFQLNVLLNSVRLPDSPKPIRFVAGMADAIMSSASNTGLSAATAGVLATISVALRDSAGNSIQQQNALDRTCLAGAAAADQCFLVPRTAIDGGISTGLPTAVNVPLTCAWVGNQQVLTCTYTANIAYRYALQLKINGVLMNLPALVMVSATAVSAPNCVANLASTGAAESGKVQTLLMQLRDRFDNNVLTTTSGFATAFTPTLSASAITPITGTGQYVQTFTPTVAGDAAYSIAITFSGTVIRGSPLSLKVVAGAASSKSRTVDISPTLVAGQTGSFSILSRDSNDNVRTSGGEGSDYLVQLVDTDSKAYDDVATIPKATSETYAVTWTTIRAGAYKLKSLVRATSAVLETMAGSQGGNFDVTVLPDVTVTAKCVAGGQGILGGVIGTNITVTALPRDQFENTQLGSVSDQFRAVLTHASGSTTVALSRAAGADKFSGSYTVPGPLAGGVTYNVNVQRLDLTVWRDLPGSPFKAMSANDAGNLFVRLSAGSNVGAIDAANNFTITELSNANAQPLSPPSGMAVAVTISSVEMSPAGSGTVPMLTVQPTAIAVSGASATSSEFKVSYSAQFTFPNGNPNFNIYVSRFGKNSESAATGIDASPFPLQLRAGAVNGPNSVVSDLPLALEAGAPVSFGITMRDLYNNAVNYDLSAGGPVTAELTPAASPAAGKVTWTATATGAGTPASPRVYQFSGTLTRADVYSVRVFYAGKQMGPPVATSASSISVRPAAPSASRTLVQLTSTQPFSGGLLMSKLVAGSAQTFSVIVRDEHSNTVEPALFPAGTTIATILSFALEDGSTALPAQFGAPEYGGGGAFSVALTAFKASGSASSFPLRVLVSGATVPVDAQVRVVNALISSESYVTVPGAAIPAGSDAAITLHAVDAYGNPWVGTVSAPVRVNGGAIYSAVVAPSASTPGLYAITLDKEFTTVIGSYVFELLAEGSPFLDTSNVATTLPVVTVVAGAVDATKTDVPSFLAPRRAGDNTSFTIALRDVFGNPIYDVSPAVLASIQLNFPLDSGESPCEDASASEVQEYGDDFFSDVAVSQSMGGGNVTVSFRGVGVGKFMVNITIGETSIDCTRLMRLRLAVSPGPAVAAHSRVVGLKDAVAGGDITLQMTLFDAYMNQLSQGGDAVLVGEAFKDASPFSPAITADPSLWLHNTSAVEDLGRGRYQVVVRPTVAGTIQVVATVDGFLIPTYAVNGSAVTPLITVTPNVPASWALEKPSAIIAATPFTVTLQVTDAWGNKISQLNGRYNYSYSVRGQTLSPTDYSFTGALKFRDGGLYDWTATSALSGDVTLYISLQQEQNAECAARDAAKPYLCSNFVCESSSDACAEAARGKGTAMISVMPATCATQADASKPWRCPDGSCQSSYAECPAIDMCTEAGKPVRCGVDGSCAASAEQCPCPAGQQRCASGTCVDQSRFGALCHNVPACVAPTAHSCELNGMATGQCRADASQCPSPRVCTPGYVACADGLSCARTFGECAVLDSPAAACPTGTFRCPNGRCTASVTDCATPKTCAAGQVLCMADGSCAPEAAQCPDQYKCAGGFICADGSCRPSADGCPSPTTCPTGWVMCENGQCSSSLASCLGAPECPLWTVRCPSGACVANRMLCSSQATCPNDAPVRCADNSCAKSIDFCVNPHVCPANSRVCPDGSCAAGLATCPTTTACPASTPVLCADGVSCVANTTSCVAPASCPVTTPMRCPDGSCRGSLIDCPSRSSCSADRPVRCADGSCVYSNQQCAVVPTCPAATPLRCPGGECVASLALCPTHVTCPLGSSRCVDGSCREDCSSALPVPCAAGQFSCPLPGVGSLCVDSQSQCPLSFICPADAPVRCLDSSCAPTVAACAPLPAKVPEVSKAPCPDGSWTTDLTTCNTPASCPTSTPFKCYDDSCRAAPADCPVPRACTTAALPYRCPNGACASSPYDSACRVTLYASCPQSAPVKCPSTSACVSDVAQCSVSKPVDALDPSTWPAACPPQWAQCRDGSCRMSPRACDPLACPANLPFLCANGVCAKNAAGCPDPLTGCYRPQMQCESTAACVDDASDPAQCPPRTDAELLACAAQCADGFCVSADNIRRLTSICSSHQCSLRCADGSCGFTGRATNITATTAGNLCTASATSDPIFTPLRNACPALLPFKCANGLCAASSTSCITLAQSVTCPSDRPVECANSACVADSSQCPPLKPTCADGEVRCGDGTCRTGQCSDWGIGNTCPLLGSGSAVRRFRCPNGFCSATADASGCPDAESGCPAGLSYKCLNGACIRKPGPGDDVAMLCAQFDAGKADGCASGEFKCEGRGECVTDESECLNNIGCPKDRPLRCDQPGSDSGKCVATKGDGNCLPAARFRCADGSSTDDPTLCRMLNGCSVETPYRCANGRCAQFGTSALLRGATLSQVCLPTVLCTASQTLCYDGSCAATPALCRPAAGCADPNVLCADRSCVADASLCATGVAGNSSSVTEATGSVALSRCPAAVPFLCDNGACVADIASCAISNSPGAGTGTGKLGAVWQQNGQLQVAAAAVVSGGNTGGATLPTAVGRCTAEAPIECFDGSCVASFGACRQRAVMLRGDAAAATANEVRGSCPAGSIMCPNGECTLDPSGMQRAMSACPVIPACGNGMQRCADGSCVASGGVCAPVTDACPSFVISPLYKPLPTRRCQDGVCRYICPAYDGCPHTSAPFQCPNRECARSASECDQAARGGSFRFADIKDSLVPPPELLTPVRRLLQATGMDSSSTGAAPPTPTPAPSGGSGEATVSDGTGRCYSNCASQVKAWSYSTMVDTSLNQRMVIATDVAKRDFMWMQVPAGSMKAANASLPTPARVSISIAPVADGVVRAAENRVPSSREDVSTSGFLTHVATVLSPMFNLSVDPLVAVPFSTNFTLTAVIDTTRFGGGGAVTPEQYADICLAKLYQLEEIGYAAWRCLYHCPTGVAPNVVLGRCAVRDSSSTGDASQVSGSVGEPGIYAFVLTPVAEPVPPSELGWVQENALWLFLGLTGAVVVIFFIVYFGQRLYRYRGKMHEEREAVKEQMREVDEMEQFGGQAGTKDDEVVMMSNPLVLQMKDMQARLDQTQLALREQEAQQKAEATVVRHEHINELQADRDALAAELERLKREVDFANQSQQQGRPQAVQMSSAAASSGLVGMGAISSDSDYSVEADVDQPVPQQRADFQAQRPKKKPKDF